ncbi:MAG: hypothetical protein VB021_09030 [Oscillospiraceae bacterium]|nr:hypothetical protein [Oscillospiraceae bacterium]
MKKYFSSLVAALLVAALALSFAACGAKAGGAAGGTGTARTGGAEALAAMPASSYDYASGISMPDFLSDDQKDLYTAAFRIYVAYCYSDAWKPDENDSYEAPNGWGYLRDAAFENYAQLRALLGMVFTEDYVKYLESTGRYIEGTNGGAYFLNGGVGSDITYIDCTYEKKSETDDALVFDIVGRFNDDAMSGEDRDPAKDYYQTFTVTLKNTDSGWRFDNFAIPDAPGLS